MQGPIPEPTPTEFAVLFDRDGEYSDHYRFQPGQFQPQTDRLSVFRTKDGDSVPYVLLSVCEMMARDVGPCDSPEEANRLIEKWREDKTLSQQMDSFDQEGYIRMVFYIFVDYSAEVDLPEEERLSAWRSAWYTDSQALIAKVSPVIEMLESVEVLPDEIEGGVAYVRDAENPAIMVKDGKRYRTDTGEYIGEENVNPYFQKGGEQDAV